jgi:tRNA dimethylallyltransferase
MNYNLITLLGPTATGKTKLAAQLADKFNGEIISADSRQVYKEMDIGTGKDLADYIVDGKKIPFYLIDIAEPRTEFNLFLFTAYFKEAFRLIISKNKIPFLAGGTGLYISSIIQNYKLKKADLSKEEIEKLSDLSLAELRSLLLNINPKPHNKTDLENKERLIKAILVARSNDESLMADTAIKSLTIGVRLERNEIKKRITERLKKRLNEGMIDEVKNLLDSGITYDRLMSFGLEYKFITLYLKSELNYEEMFNKLNSAIAQFAKRQMTWFRKMEREGIKINWIDNADFEQSAELITKNNFITNIEK